MDFLRSVTTHTVTISGRSYHVCSPSVAVVLTLLHEVPSAAQGDDDAWAHVQEIARQWLPRGLSGHLFGPEGWRRLLFWRRPEPRPVALRALMDLIALFGGETESDETDGQDPTTIEWDLVIADYCATYGTDPQVALETPFYYFVRMAGRCDAMHARSMLRYLQAKGLPYIEDERERDEAFEKLRDRSGYQEESPTTPEDQERNLDGLKAAMQTSPHYR